MELSNGKDELQEGGKEGQNKTIGVVPFKTFRFILAKEKYKLKIKLKDRIIDCENLSLETKRR